MKFLPNITDAPQPKPRVPLTVTIEMSIYDIAQIASVMSKTRMNGWYRSPGVASALESGLAGLGIDRSDLQPIIDAISTNENLGCLWAEGDFGKTIHDTIDSKFDVMD